MSGADQPPSDLFRRIFRENLNDPEFIAWMGTISDEIDRSECALLEENFDTQVTQEDVSIVPGYTDKMRGDVRVSMKQIQFDDPVMRELADDPGMKVEQVLARARKLAQSSSASDHDSSQASFIVKLIRGFDITGS